MSRFIAIRSYYASKHFSHRICILTEYNPPVVPTRVAMAKCAQPGQLGDCHHQAKRLACLAVMWGQDAAAGLIRTRQPKPPTQRMLRAEVGLDVTTGVLGGQQADGRRRGAGMALTFTGTLRYMSLERLDGALERE